MILFAQSPIVIDLDNPSELYVNKLGAVWYFIIGFPELPTVHM